MRSLKTVIVLAAALLVVPTVGARAAASLYAAATPVPDQSAAARARAFASDLAAVFVKVSGNPGAAQDGALAAALGRADQLVTEYRYRPIPAGEGGGLALWVRFEKKDVNAALAAAGEPIWGENRPNVMAWVLAPAGIVGDDLSNPVAAAMRAAALKRGLPLVLPLLDLADQKEVSEFDIRSFFLPALKTASKRYGAQAILIGTIGPKAQSGASQWRLALGSTVTPFVIPAPSPRSAAAVAVAQAATLLAQRLARLPSVGEASTLVLAVSGVNALKAEAAVQRIVAGVQGVKSLRLAQVADGSVRFVVSYAGSASDFARLLELSGLMTRTSVTPAVPLSAPFAATVPQPELDFRYTP